MVELIWDNPEIYSIRVELPQNPLRWLNSYVIKSQGEAMVIDTGFNRDECRRDLWNGINELGLDLSRTKLFLTHLHTDHIGLVGDFVERGVPVYTSSVDYEYMTRGGSVGSMESIFLQEGFPEAEIVLQKRENQGRRYTPQEPFSATVVHDGELLKVGDVEIQCISTPGHSPGHMVLYLPCQQVLFTGDHVLFDITPNITAWSNVAHSLSDYIYSLQKISSLPVRAAFPAHRNRQGNLGDRINEIIEHHGKRLHEIYCCIYSHDGATAFEIAGNITWSMRNVTWENFPPTQKWFAMGETLAHLYYLVEKGQVVRKERNGVYVYHSQNKSKDLEGEDR